MTDYAHGPGAEQARTAKAVAIEAKLRELGIPLAAARTLPPAARNRVARDAGVRPGSEETWQRVFAFMADAEQHHPPQLVSTSCRGCLETIDVPLALFDRQRHASHRDLGLPCPQPWSSER